MLVSADHPWASMPASFCMPEAPGGPTLSLPTGHHCSRFPFPSSRSPSPRGLSFCDIVPGASLCCPPPAQTWLMCCSPGSRWAAAWSVSFTEHGLSLYVPCTRESPWRDPCAPGMFPVVENRQGFRNLPKKKPL